MKKKLFENVGGNHFKLIKESSLSQTPQKLVNHDEKTIADLIFKLKIGTGIQFHKGEKSYNKFISVENHPIGDEYIYVSFDNHHDKDRYETDNEIQELAKRIASNIDYDYYEYFVVTDDDGNPIKPHIDSYEDDQYDVDYPPDTITWADIAKHER